MITRPDVAVAPRTSTRARRVLLALCSVAFALTAPDAAAQELPTDWVRIGPTPTAITNIGVVTLDPRDPGVIFFASRGPDPTRTGEDGTEGTWKTTDGGVTWQRIAHVYGSSVNSPGGIKLHPRAPDRLFVGQEDVPRWARSFDAGATFTSGSNDPYHVTDLDFDATSLTVVYAGSDRTVFKSVDSGTTWVSQAANGLPRWDSFQSATVSALVCDPVRAGVAYAGFLYAGNNDPTGVYKTVNGGQNWVPKNSGLPTTGGFFQDRAVWDLAIMPSNPQRLYATLYWKRQLYATSDAAEHWSYLAGPFPDRFNTSGASPLTVVLDPGDPQRIVVGSDEYSVFLSEDGGKSFRDLGYVVPVEKLPDGRARVTLPDGSRKTAATVNAAIGGHGVGRVGLDSANPAVFFAPSEVGLQKVALVSPVRSLALAVSASDVALSWNAVPGAGTYRVYASARADAAHASWLLLGETATPGYVDAGAASGPDDRVYSVVGVSAAGLDGVW